MAAFWLVLLMIVLPLLGLLTDLNGRELARTVNVANALMRRAEEEP